MTPADDPDDDQVEDGLPDEGEGSDPPKPPHSTFFWNTEEPLSPAYEITSQAGRLERLKRLKRKTLHKPPSKHDV